MIGIPIRNKESPSPRGIRVLNLPIDNIPVEPSINLHETDSALRGEREDGARVTVYAIFGVQGPQVINDG